MYMHLLVEVGQVLRPETSLSQDEVVLNIEQEIAVILQTKFDYAAAEVVSVGRPTVDEEPINNTSYTALEDW